MDNLGNLGMINIEYGPLVLKVFDFIDSIQISPDLEPDQWLTFNDKNDRSQIKIFNKNQAMATDEFEDGFLLRTVPFGSVVYPIIFAVFWILFRLKKYIVSRMNLRALSKLPRCHPKRVSWFIFTRVVKLFYDLKQFLFNLFVLDLGLAACFELCQSNILAKMFTEKDLSSGAIFSMLLSATCIVLIIFEFYYTLAVNQAVKMTKEADKYLFIKAKIEQVDKLNKKNPLKKSQFTELPETKLDNKEEVLVLPGELKEENILMSENAVLEEKSASSE